jgi:hypothetical protein
MDKKRSEFLTTMIAILRQLSDTSVKQGEPLLASVIAIAREEAEDALRHAGDLDTLEALRQARSSRVSWRACDRPDAAAEKAVKKEADKQIAA